MMRLELRNVPILQIASAGVLHVYPPAYSYDLRFQELLPYSMDLLVTVYRSLQIPPILLINRVALITQSCYKSMDKGTLI